MSQPCARSSAAIRTASSAVVPPGAQSVAEILTEIGLPAGQDGAHGVEHLERVAHAVLERPAVVVGPHVGERRDEARQQVAVRHVELEHVEARRLGHLRGADELVADQVHVGAGHLPRHLAVREVRERRRREERPVPLRERLVDPLPQRRVEPLRPAWASWRAIRAPVCRWTKSTMRRQASTCSGLYIPVQPGLIRPSRLTSVISAMTSPAPPSRAAAEVHEVPVVRRAVLGRVLAHRRDDDPVRQHEVAQPERREHRRRGGPARRGTPLCRAASLGEPAVDRRDEAGVAHLEVLVGDAEAPREEAERELERLEPPGSARSSRTTRGSPGRRAGGSRPRAAARPRRPRAPRDVRRGAGARGERDGVLHGELRPRADREVRGVGGVADQHDVAVRPALVPARSGSSARAIGS